MAIQNNLSKFGAGSVMQELERAQTRLSVLENTISDLLEEIDTRWSDVEALARSIDEGKNLA